MEALIGRLLDGVCGVKPGLSPYYSQVNIIIADNLFAL